MKSLLITVGTVLVTLLALRVLFPKVTRRVAGWLAAGTTWTWGLRGRLDTYLGESKNKAA
jgi:hypothetical protein